MTSTAATAAKTAADVFEVVQWEPQWDRIKHVQGSSSTPLGDTTASHGASRTLPSAGLPRLSDSCSAALALADRVVCPEPIPPMQNCSAQAWWSPVVHDARRGSGATRSPDSAADSSDSFVSSASSAVGAQQGEMEPPATDETAPEDTGARSANRFYVAAQSTLFDDGLSRGVRAQSHSMRVCEVL